MEASKYRTLRDSRAVVEVGSVGRCFIASNISHIWEDWNKGPSSKKDVLREDEVCFVLELRKSRFGDFMLARVMYSRGFGWMREDSLTAEA